MERLHEWNEEISKQEPKTLKEARTEIETLLYDDSKGDTKSVYAQLSASIVELISRYKDRSYEEPVDSLGVWPIYDSRLQALKNSSSFSAKPVRITNDRPYYWREEGDPGTVSAQMDPSGLWFKFITECFENSEQRYADLKDTWEDLLPPSIHKLLVHSKRSDCETALVLWRSFKPPGSSSDSSDHQGPKQIEARILARDLEGPGRKVKYKHIGGSYNDLDDIRRQLKALLNEELDNDNWNPSSAEKEQFKEVWVRWYSIFVLRALLRDQYKIDSSNWEDSDDAFYKAASGFLKEEDSYAWTQMDWAAMTTVRVHVPGTEADLGSVMIFSKQVLGSALVDLISSTVWPIFSYLRQIEERLIGSIITKKEGAKAAVSAIMSRNMSHHEGSHILPRARISTIRERFLKICGKVPNIDNIELLKDRLDEYLQGKAGLLGRSDFRAAYHDKDRPFLRGHRGTADTEYALHGQYRGQ